MTTAVIVTAAGSGSRLGYPQPKALVRVAGRTILEWAIDGVIRSGSADVIVVTAPPEHLDDVRAQVLNAGGVALFLDQGYYGGRSVTTSSGVELVVVAGGSSRQESVSLALDVLPRDVDVVLVHDAARPLTPPEIFRDVARAVEDGYRAVIPALPVTDTIKSIDGSQSGLERVSGTVDREALRAVQTPQGFDRALLDRAHAVSPVGDVATDDAALVEELGHSVWLIPGSEMSLKITTPFDLKLAEFLLSSGSLP